MTAYVELLTAAGEHVGVVLVDTPGAMVLFWGTRCFVRQPDYQTYREGTTTLAHTVNGEQAVLPFVNSFVANQGRRDLD